MAKKVGNYPIPYSATGNLMQYVYWSQDCLDWRENVPFHAKLTFDSMYSGRSAKGYVFNDEDGHQYPMFAGSLATIFKIPEVVITGGSITATWVVVKKGRNYGIELYEVG